MRTGALFHRTNLDGVFLGCKHSIRAMRPQGTGSIINISSRFGSGWHTGGRGLCVFKGGSAQSHQDGRTLLCEQGLQITLQLPSCPAAVLTPMWEPMLGDGPERAKYMADFVCGHATPALCRAGRSAALAVLLASDEATYMTGAELTIDTVGLLAGSASGALKSAGMRATIGTATTVGS